MNAHQVSPDGYTQFALDTRRAYSAAEAARVRPDWPDPPAYDAFTRLLHRLEPDRGNLWTEFRHRVRLHGGVLIIDDPTPDKPSAKSIQ